MSLRVVAAAALSAAMLSVTGCPSPSEPSACTPGQSVSCTCAGGSTSAQICRADGSGFEACQCVGTPDSAARDGGTAERDVGMDGGPEDTGTIALDDTGVDAGAEDAGVAPDAGIDGGLDDAGTITLPPDATIITVPPDAASVIVSVDASTSRDAFRSPDTNPAAVCSMYPGITPTLVSAIPASCTPRCAAATLDAVNLCVEGSPPSCVNTAIMSDMTPTISMPFGATDIDLDCGTCFDINRFHCFSLVCMTQSPAYLGCDPGRDADMCMGELTALQTCLNGIPVGSSRETTLNECFATEVTACFDVGGGFAPGGASVRPTSALRASANRIRASLR